MLPDEATWVVIYGGKMWHNFEPIPATFNIAISCPVVKAFLIYHKSWRYDDRVNIVADTIKVCDDLYEKISKEVEEPIAAETKQYPCSDGSAVSPKTKYKRKKN